MAFCRRIPLKERKNVSRCERPTKIRDDESETMTSIDSFIFSSPPDGADSNQRDHHRDERYITLDHASVVPPPFDRSLIAKHEDDDQDGSMPRISPYRKKTPTKRSTAKSPKRKRMRCINVPRVGISFDTEKTSRLKTEFMERLQNEKKARLGKNYQPGGAEVAKVAPKPERQVPSTAQRARAREKNSQFFLLHSSTVDGRKTAEKNQDVVANDSKDVISCNSFVTTNPTAAASMSAQLWTVICNSKSVSMRQLPISKVRSSSKGIFYRGRRAKYNSSPKEELESPHELNKRYKDSPEIVNAVNDWILNYDSRCDESTDALDVAAEPQSLTHSAAAYYSSLRLPSERQQEIRNSHPAYSYGLETHRSYMTGDTLGGGVASGRELKQLLAARENHHYARSVVGAPERHSPNTKHGNQRKRASHGYNKSGRRRSSNSMGSGKTGELRTKAVYGKGAESERSNNRCESVESSTCDDDVAKITKTLEPHDSRQEVVVWRPFQHKEMTAVCEEAAIGEVVCASTNMTVNNNNQNEGKSSNDVSAAMSTASVSPRTRFGDTCTKEGATRKQSGLHSGGQRSFTRQASAHSAHDGNSTPVSRVRDNSQTQKKIYRCQLRRQVSEPKTRANVREIGHSLEAILPSVSEMTKSSSASPVNFDLHNPTASGAKQPSYHPNDDPASTPEVKKTRIKKLVRTLPRQTPRPRQKNITKAHSATSVRNKASPPAPKNERSPNGQESRKSLFSVSSAGISSRPEDGKLSSPDKSDQPDLSAPSTVNTTPTRTCDHQVNETFTISPKLNHRIRKKRIHLKRLKGDLLGAGASKRPAGNVSESSSRPTGEESLTPEKPARDVVHTDSETKDYEPRSTTSCNTSNIFSVIHEIVGNRKIQKIVPPPIVTNVAAEPWPTSPKIKQEKEKKVITPPASVVKKRKPLRLYKRYRITPKKSSSVATSKLSKDTAPERKVSTSSRMSHRHRRSLNPTKKLKRASALELKCPVRIEQLSHRPARSQNGNKIASQPAKKNVKALSTANSPAAFSDKGVQVKRYSSDESKAETQSVDLYGSGLLNSEQIKSTVHKRLYSVRTNSHESVRSEAVPKHHDDFQRFIAMTRHARSDNSLERLSDHSSPQSHGEVLDKTGSSVDAPDRHLPRKFSNNELDFSGVQKADVINTLLSNGEADPYDAGGGAAMGKMEHRHRHGVRTSLKMPQEDRVEGKENIYLKMLFSGDKIASAPNQASMSSENKSDLSSSVDPLIYESSRDQRRLSSPRTSVPYEREELKLSIPDAFLPYIRRAREYYVISQTLLHPQYKHVMRDRVPKSKEGSAPTSVSNFSEGKPISTADGSRKGPGSKETIDLDALWPQSKARKKLSKDSSPKKKHRVAQEKTTKQLTANSRSSPAVDRQASSSPKVKAKVKPPASIPKVSSEKTVYKPSISRLAAPRQVSKPYLPLRPKKRAESAVSGALMKNRTETSEKRFVSKDQPVRAANPAGTLVLPKLEKFASPGSEKRTPPRKSRVNKASPASGGKKEGPSKQLPPLKVKVAAPKESSVSTNGSEQTVTTSSSDDKYKEPPSEAALRQTLAYLNYVKTGTRLKFPENEIQMIKYLSTSEPTLLPVGTPSKLRQTRKTMAHNRRSTAPLWSERGNPAKLRKLEAGSKGTTNWTASTSTNQKVKSQASSSKQKKRRIKKLGKNKLLTNCTNNKYMKSESSSSQRSKLKSKPRASSSASPSYGSGIWQQPSNLRENLLLLSALNRCRNNSDRASDGVKDFATLYDLQSELSGRNVYIPKVLQNILAEREKSQKCSRLLGKKKKTRAVPAKFGNAKRHRKVNSLHSKRAPRKPSTKSGISLQQVSLTTRKPVTSQTITNMIKKTFTGKDMIGKSIQGLVSDLKSISETLKASPARLFGDGRPVFARRPVGPLSEKVLERNSTRVDSSDSTLNSSQTTGGDSELTSEESDTVMKEGISETKVNDNSKNLILDTGGIVQGGRKIWSAAYDRVVKMLSGDKVPTEPKNKPKPKKLKKRDLVPVAGKKMSISEKVPKRALPKPPSMPFEPAYLHVAGDAILSKLNLAADPKSCALLKLGTELRCADGVPLSKPLEKTNRSYSNKRRVVKTSKEKKSPKIPVSRFHM